MSRPGHEQIRCVVADPPWLRVVGEASVELFGEQPAEASPAPTTAASISLAEILALAPATAPLAHLWLWTPAEHADWGHKTARAWGFTPMHVLAWAKPRISGANTEHILLARKGGPRGNAFGRMPGTHYPWPLPLAGRPDEFFNLVERVSPGPYLAMFGDGRPGWDAWSPPSCP